MRIKGFKDHASSWCKARAKEWPMAIVGIAIAVPAESMVQTAIAHYDPDFFGMTVEHVIESQNDNFSKVQASIDDLKAVTTDNAAAQSAITQLSKNLEMTVASNQELTTKLKTVAEDRELLREELKKKKGGDIVPTIAIAEYQTIQYPDLGVLGLTDYYEPGRRITFRINDTVKTVNVGESVKITKADGEICRLVYRGLHEDKHGVEKVCDQNT
jgi:hypothetical protein